MNVGWYEYSCFGSLTRRGGRFAGVSGTSIAAGLGLSNSASTEPKGTMPRAARKIVAAGQCRFSATPPDTADRSMGATHFSSTPPSSDVKDRASQGEKPAELIVLARRR